MAEVMANWSPDFMVSLLRDYVLPILAGGVVLGGIFWLVGYLVENLFKLLK